MWMLCVRVGVIVLVLGDVEALQLHILLGTGRWALYTRLPSGLWIWLCSCIKSLSLNLEDLKQELSYSEEGMDCCINRSWSNLVLQGKPEGISMSN
jgi:hypothetical protein